MILRQSSIVHYHEEAYRPKNENERRDRKKKSIRYDVYIVYIRYFDISCSVMQILLELLGLILV